MKTTSKIIFTVVILIIVLLWNWYGSEQSFTSSPPNVVSFDANTASIEPKTAASRQKQSASETLDTAINLASLQYKTNPGSLSYLAVYRMTRSWTTCQTAISGILNNPDYDPIASLESQYSRLFPELNIVPNDQKIQATLEHTQMCRQLLQKINQLDLVTAEILEDNGTPSFHYLKQVLNDYLQTLKPRTAKEIEIAQVVNLKPTWQQLFQSVLVASKGDETANKQAIDELNDQMQNLRTRLSEIWQLLKQTEDKTDLRIELGQLYSSRQKIAKDILNLRVVDTESRAQAIADFETVNDQMFQFLNSKNPDVFYEAQMTLEMNNRAIHFGFYPYKDIGKEHSKLPFIEYVSPGDLILQMTNMSDVELFALVIQPATQLYHCELGADCGPESQWVKAHCIDSYALMAAASCQMDLVSFYRDVWMSENQWEDVQAILTIIRDLYEG